MTSDHARSPPPPRPRPPCRPAARRERIARLRAPVPVRGARGSSTPICSTSRCRVPPPRCLGVLAIVAVCPLAWALARSRVTRPTRLGLGVVVGLLSDRLRRRLAWPPRRQLRARLARRHRRRPRFSAGSLLVAGRPRRRRRAAPCTPAGGPRAARRARRRLARRAPRLARRERRCLVPAEPDHPRPALGDPRVGARDPARGGPGRRSRDGRSSPPGTCPRATARPAPVSHGSGGSRGRLPAARPHARAPRLRRARARHTPATAGATATPTASATTRSRRIEAGARLPRARAPTCSPTGSPASASRSVGRSCSRRPLATARLAAVVSDGVARPGTPTRPHPRGRVERAITRPRLQPVAGDLRHARPRGRSRH